MTNDWKHVPLGKSGWPEVPYAPIGYVTEVRYSQHMGLPMDYRFVHEKCDGVNDEASGA